MLFTGLTGITLPRGSFIDLSIAVRHLSGNSYHSLVSNVKYMPQYLTNFAFELKREFFCEDCPNSPIIYNNNFCVEVCPRSFSVSFQNGIQFCDTC